MVEAVADAASDRHMREGGCRAMMGKGQVKIVQDYMNLLGKIYIILLSSLDRFYGGPLSTNEKVVLQILDEKAISIKEISQRTGLALSTLTSVIDKMEDKRLVRRRQSSTDRRMVKVELAFTGRRLKRKYDRLIEQISVSLLEILGGEDRRIFTAVLEKTATVISSEAGGVQEVLEGLGEPLKMTLASEFKKK